MTSRLPGQRTGRTYTARDVLLSDKGVDYARGVILDATYCKDGGFTNYTQELRPGVILGKMATGLWCPCKLTSIASGTSGSGSSVSTTTFNVTDARHFQVADIISVPTAAGRISKVISAIDYTTNIITVSVAIANSLITTQQSGIGIENCIYPHSSDPATGCEIPRAVLNEHVNLIDVDDQTARDRTVAKAVIAGVVDDAMILGDLAACRAASDYRAGDTSNESTSRLGFLEHIIWADRSGF